MTACEPSIGGATRRAPCPLLGRRVALPEKPQRIVCLVSGLTEALWDMGLKDRVAAVSRYCSRYVPIGQRPVAGSYLQIDETVLKRVRPDLVLMTAGVQLGVAKRLAASGWPVYVLPLPESFHGILENIRRLGALCGEMQAAFGLTERMQEQAAQLRRGAPPVRPRILAELWCGRHVRVAGGLTFIQDLITLAGGENVMAAAPEGYLKLDLKAAETARPDAVVVFWEKDDHAVDVPRLLQERGWTGKWPFRLVEAGIERGQNLIHDGPSVLETARWLSGQIAEKQSPL